MDVTTLEDRVCETVKASREMKMDDRYRHEDCKKMNDEDEMFEKGEMFKDIPAKVSGSVAYHIPQSKKSNVRRCGRGCE